MNSCCVSLKLTHQIKTECRTPEREVGGSKPTAAVLCPWARHFTPRKYWLITQEAVAPSRHDWKIVDWDVKPQHKQTNKPNKDHLWTKTSFLFSHGWSLLTGWTVVDWLVNTTRREYITPMRMLIYIDKPDMKFVIKIVQQVAAELLYIKNLFWLY